MTVATTIAKRPNFLIIMADQLAPHFTGTYGHPLVKTPNLDKLAAIGSRFDAAYCNSPLCAPARFSFMSGQLITKIAAYDNASEFPASIPTFAHYLKALGYSTCLAGKMHFIGPDQLHGFAERLNTDIYPSDFAWSPDWEQPDERIDKWYHNMDSVREAGVAADTFHVQYDEESCFLTRRKLFEYAHEKETPFLMVASFINPHDPYACLQKDWDLYDHDAIEIPDRKAFPFEDADPMTQRLMVGMEAHIDAVTDDEMRNARHAYYANVSFIDRQIGILVETLKQADLYDNTIIMVTADHGDMLGERGIWYKMNHFEHSGRVPLVISGPDIHQQAVASPCSHVDLLPTLLDYACNGLENGPELGMPIDGRSLRPVLTTGEDTDNIAIGEYCAEMTAHPLFMIRKGAFKYIHCDTDPPLLFNIDEDPLEANNLAPHPDYRDMATDFAEEVERRWDSKAVRADVLAKQKQRRAVAVAMETGAIPSWDYSPKQDTANQWVRNHIDWQELAAKTRYPQV